MAKGMYRNSLDADIERKGAKEIDWNADSSYDIDEKEKIDAEYFEKAEKAWKEAQSVTEQIKALDGMSREQLEAKREELLSQKSAYGPGYSLSVMSAIEKRIVESLDGMTKEQLENERTKLLSLEKNTKYPYFLSAAIDKRIKQAERLEKDALNKSTQSRAIDYTGPLAAFMVHSEEGQEKAVDASTYTTNQVTNPYIALAFSSPERREQLEAELAAEFATTKAKEAEIGRIDKATHGLEELAQGHEIEIDKGDKDF